MPARWCCQAVCIHLQFPQYVHTRREDHREEREKVQRFKKVKARRYRCRNIDLFFFKFFNSVFLQTKRSYQLCF